MAPSTHNISFVFAMRDVLIIRGLITGTTPDTCSPILSWTRNFSHAIFISKPQLFFLPPITFFRLRGSKSSLLFDVKIFATYNTQCKKLHDSTYIYMYFSTFSQVECPFKRTWDLWGRQLCLVLLFLSPGKEKYHSIL